MKVIVITGKTGSGKNKLSEKLSEKLGYKHIDIDKVCHTCYEDENILNKVREYFGKNVFDGDKVNRKKLGSIVFNDKEKMQYLTNLTYNYVVEKIDKIIAESKQPIILNYVLLPNTKYFKDCDYRILVKCNDDDKRYKHLVMRDNVPLEYIMVRDNNSLNYNENDYNYVFVNDYDENTLETNIDKIVKEISNKKGK